MDENYQAGTEGLKYAAKKGMGVVIMEPLRGGNLARNVPDEVKAVYDKADVKRSPAEWCFRFVWNHPEVSLVLSGMNDMEHIKENIRISNAGYPNSLSEKEIAIINEVKEVYKLRTKVNCTSCKYCMPCPFGVDIPRNFALLNNASIYGNVEGVKQQYNSLDKEGKSAANCRECGRCEKACPQHIEIRKMLKEVVKTLG